MTQNQFKYYSSLLKKKFRDQEKKFLLEGHIVLLEALHSPHWASLCEIVFVTQHFIDENPDIITKLGAGNFKIEKLKEKEFGRISDTVTPQGISAVFRIPEKSFKQTDDSKIIVALDNISDPGNLGTIIRNCDWFGIQHVIISSGSAELFNPKTIRSSMGSLFHINIDFDVELADYIKAGRKNGYHILLADLKGTNVFSFHMNGKIIAIFSNEANGPSKNILALADEKITIPKIGNAESLNVASASAVILSQLTK